MNTRNREIKSSIEANKLTFSALRRADIAHQFRAYMVEKKIKNVDVAERLGVSEANVSRWLNGSQNLSLDTLYGIADALEESLILKLGDSKSQPILLALDDEEEDWKKGKGFIKSCRLQGDMTLYSSLQANLAANDPVDFDRGGELCRWGA